MADISLPQVIHNVKEKYLLATGDTDTVKYGNIDTKVYDAITSAGAKANGTLAHPFIITAELNAEMRLAE